ncbi:hypothetical protein C7K38_06995 [Tetragenococcus osmophilus]|uniref:Alpha/beta hydrolase n=1 Tax=Tetragenococcus osmophilus TaxID=526944 RepID=A0AA38CVR4_9ENTE|nr:alpha/beta hydrolase [Tetragenococcus osmophilus]AYW48140.1 hypothetical protein C7K38_06995 [Tetragenococcus osmophilus]GMA53903.1 hypothetical protein GCM10025857_52600 [Alicyclobacillus contaminans]GMA72188.1 hypothetical protein GCM10025885_12370 [Tetragenococcus osmophilus]
MKKFLFPLGLLFALLLVGCQSSSSAKAQQNNQSNQSSNTTQASEDIKASQQSETTIEKSATPTLFVHGHQGTVNSFRSMINYMEEENIAEREMVVTVHPDGSLDTEGELSGERTNPIIQVIFEDNVNNEWNQTEWIQNTLSSLKEDYQLDQVNLVGHSMGGVSSYRYMGTYGQEESLPEINKFIGLGAPFNDFINTSDHQSLDDLLDNGPEELSERYQDFEELTPQISQDTKILLIAGQLSESDFSDGMVPLTSALSVYPLLEANEFDVDYSIVNGQNAQHSMLHENNQVNEQIAQFLWE